MSVYNESIKNLREMRQRFLKVNQADEIVFNYFEQVYAIVASYIHIIKDGDSYALKINDNINQEQQYNVIEFKQLFDDILKMIPKQIIPTDKSNVETKKQEVESKSIPIKNSQISNDHDVMQLNFDSRNLKSGANPIEDEKLYFVRSYSDIIKSLENENAKMLNKINQNKELIKQYQQKINEKSESLNDLKSSYYTKLKGLNSIFNDVYPQFENLYDYLIQHGIQISITKNSNTFDLLIETEKLTPAQHKQIKDFKLMFKYIKMIIEN